MDDGSKLRWKHKKKDYSTLTIIVIAVSHRGAVASRSMVPVSSFGKKKRHLYVGTPSPTVGH